MPPYCTLMMFSYSLFPKGNIRKSGEIGEVENYGRPEKTLFTVFSVFCFLFSLNMNCLFKKKKNMLSLLLVLRQGLMYLKLAWNQGGLKLTEVLLSMPSGITHMHHHIQLHLKKK